jgi:hypothetical protein
MFDKRSEKIRLHPDRMTRWVVLHEMAHWLDPTARSIVTQGERFRTNHVELLRAAFGKAPHRGRIRRPFFSKLSISVPVYPSRRPELGPTVLS